MNNKDYINSEIIKCYAIENNEHLAKRLNISEGYLRVKAKRLGVKKITTTITNKIIDGYKLCPHCLKMKNVNEGAFNRDKYQANGFDYWCKECRAVQKHKQQEEVNKIDVLKSKHNKETAMSKYSMAFGVKKTRNPIVKVLNSQGELVDGLKCKGSYCNNAVKPLEAFYKAPRNISGHMNICIECYTLKAKEVRAKAKQQTTI